MAPTRQMICVVLAALLLAACGGDEEDSAESTTAATGASESSSTDTTVDEETTTEEADEPLRVSPGARPRFVEEVNSGCRAFAVATQAQRERLGPAFDPVGAIRLVEAVVPVAEKHVRRLEAADPRGAADPEAFEEFAETEGRRVELLEETVAVLRAEDEAAFEELRDEDLELQDRSRREAASAGLAVCAGKLPGAEIRAVERTIRRGMSSSDPRLVCDKLVTRSFLELQYGGRARCEAAQRAAEEQAELPDSVEVTDVYGIAGVEAEAEVSVEGGTADGLTARFGLVYDGGVWKVDRLTPTAGGLPSGAAPA